jgi:uncharacterized protein (DUF2147 family)
LRLATEGDPVEIGFSGNREAETVTRLLSLAAVLALGAAPAALAADAVEGTWLLPDGNSKVTIAPCPNAADRLCGVVSWLKSGAPKDTNNPDASLRTRPILGLQVIRDVKPAGAGKWGGGKIYDPQSGKTYSSKITLTSNDKLKVEGCVMMVCQPQTWTR